MAATRKYFGTDGIRGRANSFPITPELALKAGMAAGLVFTRGDHRHRVVIGKDTRLSSYMIENALTAGFLAVGMDVLLTGPIPTPGIAMLTRSMRCDIGVMISASHNPFDDNGIKLFGPDGLKLSDAVEAEIEGLIESDVSDRLAAPAAFGRAKRIDGEQARYIEFAKRTLPRNMSLSGIKVVVDCANGAGYKVAPAALWELGAEVVAIGDKPDGFNINRDVGSTAPAALAQRVVDESADIGVALDGDADRLVVVDEHGRTVDGDQLLGVIAESWAAEGRLTGGGVAVSVMSNLGLERYLSSIGIAVHRTAVGDRYIAEAMRDHKLNLGGESSGHIIMSDYATTGDGLVAALQIMAVIKEDGGPASDVCDRFDPVPQILRNVRHGGGAPLEAPRIRELIAGASDRLADGGRLIVRASGTEPVIRVMAEGDDRVLVETVVDELVAALGEVG